MGPVKNPIRFSKKVSSIFIETIFGISNWLAVSFEYAINQIVNTIDRLLFVKFR